MIGAVVMCHAVHAQMGAPRTMGRIERLDPALDALIPAAAQLEVIGEGLEWSEGPVWIKQGGFLLFSDVLANTIYRWDAAGGCRPYLTPSGYTSDVPRGGETGSNGLALDKDGRLLLCQHGDRRVARLATAWDERPPRFETLADKFDGKRFNSPNDLVVHSSGAIYFTDPPYGLERNISDPARQLDFQGVYRIAPDGAVTLLTREMERPNGIALSPDEKTLYVANSHGPRPVIMAFPLREDGTTGDGRVFLDARNLPGRRQGAFDGMKIDRQGNLFATGPGGVLVLSPQGKHLGTLFTTQRTANCAFGEDGATLFITADDFLLRVRVSTQGAGF
jgi:gluconolactonase